MGPGTHFAGYYVFANILDLIYPKALKGLFFVRYPLDSRMLAFFGFFILLLMSQFQGSNLGDCVPNQPSDEFSSRQRYPYGRKSMGQNPGEHPLHLPSNRPAADRFPLCPPLYIR